MTEQTFLREAARRRLPSYDFRLHSNDDDITWAVLLPQRRGVAMPRFTICRIDPCVMVMVEDQSERRRFCSLHNVDEAISFACRTAEQAVVAVLNVHPSPEAAQ